MLYVIDRIVADQVICETPQKDMISFKRSLFAEEIQEGDCVRQSLDGMFYVDKEETRRRKQRSQERMRHLFE